MSSAGYCLSISPCRLTGNGFRRAGMLLLILLMTFAGPASCVAHCFLLDLQHGQQHTHVTYAAVETHHAATTDSHSHAEHTKSSHHSIPEEHSHPTAHEEPSALTIGIVHSVQLVPVFLSETRLSPEQALILQTAHVTPPRDPPRL